jgi:hypothetical protein
MKSTSLKLQDFFNIKSRVIIYKNQTESFLKKRFQEDFGIDNLRCAEKLFEIYFNKMLRLTKDKETKELLKYYKSEIEESNFYRPIMMALYCIPQRNEIENDFIQSQIHSKAHELFFFSNLTLAAFLGNKKRFEKMLRMKRSSPEEQELFKLAFNKILIVRNNNRFGKIEIYEIFKEINDKYKLVDPIYIHKEGFTKSNYGLYNRWKPYKRKREKNENISLNPHR